MLLLHINCVANISQSRFENSSGGTPNPWQNTNSVASNSNHKSGNSQSSSSEHKSLMYKFRNERSTGVLLGTAVVQLYHLGNFYRARALINTGSESKLISDTLFRLLGLLSRSISVQISGLNNRVSVNGTKICSLVLNLIQGSIFRLMTTLYLK